MANNENRKRKLYQQDNYKSLKIIIFKVFE